MRMRQIPSEMMEPHFTFCLSEEDELGFTYLEIKDYMGLIHDWCHSNFDFSSARAWVFHISVTHVWIDREEDAMNFKLRCC